jgi:hypothetical protein
MDFGDLPEIIQETITAKALGVDLEQLMQARQWV